MIETELKILIGPEDEAALSEDPVLAELRMRPRRTETLVSTYFDTPDHDLAAAGIALRLRKAGRRWIQTIKRKDSGVATPHGLFSHAEIERPAPGGKLDLDGPDERGAYAAILAAAGGADIGPIFETRVRRIVERLAAPGGGEVEVALDRGEIVAGDLRALILEAELELVTGGVDAVFEVARRLFRKGPLRFATANKAARGYRLVTIGSADADFAVRNAGKLSYNPGTPIETVARDVLRDCFAQISINMAVVVDSEVPEGPHQLRVGLRRLRTALDVLGPSLGGEALAPLSDAARDIGRSVGALRDLDVLIDDVVAPATAGGLDEAARSALLDTLCGCRDAVRAEVRTALSGPESVGFALDLARMVETRGWLKPSDYSQTARLATPVGDLAPRMMRRRAARVAKKARRLRHLDTEALHALRKELKQLRYAAEILEPIHRDRKVTSYIRSLKRLQDTFGSLNDATMARDILTGPDAPGRDDPDIQRAVGWVLGRLDLKSESDRPDLYSRYDKFAETDPFWT